MVSSTANPQTHNLRPPAERTVIFTVDGLSIDRAFGLDNDRSTPYMPSIRNVIRREGRWGLARTRPTGRSDGHLTGVDTPYDDVTLDSVLYSCDIAWIWSCVSDPLIKHYATDNIMLETSSLCTANSTQYNTWIWKDIEQLLLIRSNENAIADQLSRDKAIFILSMNATDSNLNIIDDIINRTTNLVDSYFQTQKTSFLLFSTGLPDSSEPVPFVAWGAGIKHPRSALHGDYRYHDNLGTELQLEKFERIDLDIIDVAPFVSVLMGLRIPFQSNGILPHGYIHYNKEFIAEALFANAKQFMQRIQVMEDSIRNHSLPYMFRPFRQLSPSNRAEFVLDIELLIKERRLQQVIDDCITVISVCKEAIKYFNKYHEISLKVSLSLSLIGWSVYTAQLLLKESINEYSPFKENLPSIPCIVLCFVTVYLQYHQNVQMSYYFYHCLPWLCWDFVFKNFRNFLKTASAKIKRNRNQFIVNVLVIVVLFIGLELLIVGMVHHSGCLSLLMFVVGISVPMVTLGGAKHSIGMWITWSVPSLMIGSSPFHPSWISTSLMSLTLIMLLLILLVYIQCNPPLNYRLSAPRMKLCRPVNMLIIDTIICGLTCVSGTIRMNSTHLVSELAIVDGITVMIALFLLLLGPKSVPGRLLHVSTLLYIIFHLVCDQSHSLLVLSLSVMLSTALCITDTTHSSTGIVNDTLWSGVFGCLCYSDFPSRTTPNLPRSTSTNDLYRSGMTVLLTLLYAISIIITSPAYQFVIPQSLPFINFSIIQLTITLLIPYLYIYCAYNVIAVKLQTSLTIIYCSLFLLFDALAIQAYLVMDDNKGYEVFMCIVLNALSCPWFLLLARLLTGDSIIPRKTVDKH